MRIAMRDDGAGHALAHAGDPCEQRRGGGVDLDTHRIHAILHHAVEGARELVLGEIVLILPDADGFRIDLDEFRQRVLKSPCDRDRATQGDVEIWQFAAGIGRGRIDRGARFRDDDLGEITPLHAGVRVHPRACRVFSREAVAVADGDEADITAPRPAVTGSPARHPSGFFFLGRADRHVSVATTLAVASTTATLSRCDRPESSPIVTRAPAGAGEHQSRRFSAKTRTPAHLGASTGAGANQARWRGESWCAKVPGRSPARNSHHRDAPVAGCRNEPAIASPIGPIRPPSSALSRRRENRAPPSFSPAIEREARDAPAVSPAAGHNRIIREFRPCSVPCPRASFAVSHAFHPYALAQFPDKLGISEQPLSYDRARALPTGLCVGDAPGSVTHKPPAQFCGSCGAGRPRAQSVQRFEPRPRSDSARVWCGARP